MITKNCEICGKEFSKYPSYFKNRSGRFCSKKCDLKNNSVVWKQKNPRGDTRGENNPMYGKTPWNYRAGGSRRKDGYMRVTIGKRRILLHRHIMEGHLGRKLTRSEIVHHIDGNNKNNDIENLKVMTQNEHIALHRPMMRERLLQKIGANHHTI